MSLPNGDLSHIDRCALRTMAASLRRYALWLLALSLLWAVPWTGASYAAEAKTAGTPTADISAHVLDVESRPGVHTLVQVLTPARPRAVLLLFPGANGVLGGFTPEGRPQNVSAQAPLLEARRTLAENGVMVALIDAPSDRQSRIGLLGWRRTPEHLRDIAEVIAALKRQLLLDRGAAPLWVMGIDHGAISAARTAIKFKARAIQGAIFVSPLIASDYAGALTTLPLEQIDMPVLVLHHQQDACERAPFDRVPALRAALSNAPRKVVIGVEGGGPPQGGSCSATHYHGLAGMELTAMKAIAAFIESVQLSAKAGSAMPAAQ